MNQKIHWTLALCALCAASAPARADEAEDWSLHAQSTYIRQLKPGFSSPYEGAHSLTGASESSYSFTATAGLGARLGEHTQAYWNPEVAQGVPLSGLQGLGGFTNGEMARSSGPRPTWYRARLFLRHEWGLSAERESVEAGMNQLAGTQAVQRLVLTAGNLSVLDLFDGNRYSHDPRTQFMNWTLMTHGAYDYAADARGYSWGAALEYVVGDWTLRAGRFMQPREPNQQVLDPRIGPHHGDQLELERRYQLGDQPGAWRVLAFRNRAVMARYDAALQAGASAGVPPDLNTVRDGAHIKAGVGVNVEQAVSASLGLFARAMWADGKTETYAFTEVDRSASAGAVWSGQAWGRQDDVVGVAVAINALSATHRAVLAQGGLTFFLGDGRLRYRPEQVMEAYYLWTPARGLGVSLDVQHLMAPGYNADRGPVSTVALRLHIEC